MLTKAVIDTGPLFTVITLNFLNQIRCSQVKRRNVLERVIVDDDIRINPLRQGTYFDIFTNITRPLTTSHVIGELHGLQKSCLGFQGSDLQRFWSHSIDFLFTRNFDEKLIRVLEICARKDSREAACRIGLTDIGLIQLAMEEACVLLTEDERTLAPHAWTVGVDCRLMKSLV